MKAILKPLVPSPHRPPEPVELLGRHRNGRVKVRTARGAVFAVDAFRLAALGDPTRRLSPAELAALPPIGPVPDRGTTDLAASDMAASDLAASDRAARAGSGSR